MKQYVQRLSSALAATIVAACFLSAPPSLYAQGNGATLTGIVYDQTGAVVPAATVTLTNQESGEARVTESNKEGFFSFTAAPPATYTVTVEKAGFAKYIKKDLTAHASDQLAVTGIVLKAGAAKQTIEVVGSSDAVPVDTDTKSQIVTASEIQNLSTLGRNAVELLKILPGMVDQGGFNGELTMFTGNTNLGVGGTSINGSSIDSISIAADGQDVVDECHCGVHLVPNMDMIQEFKVQTSNYGSDTPNGPVVIQTVTKSGGSKYHGEGYYYVRHFSLNAVETQVKSNAAQIPHDRFQYPGFNIGGPVMLPHSDFNKNRDKLFFWAGFEWQRQSQDQLLHRAIVPTAAMRTGNFSDFAYLGSLNGYDVSGMPCNTTTPSALCSGTPGVLNSNAIDAGGQVLMNAYQQPNADPTTHQGFNYISDLIRPANRAVQNVRMDYNFSQNTKLYARYAHEAENIDWPYTLWWSGSDVPYPGTTRALQATHAVSANLVSTFNPSLTNEVIIGFDWTAQNDNLADPSKVRRGALGYTHQGLFPVTPDRAIPNYTDWGGGVATLVQPSGISPGLRGGQSNRSLADNLTKVRGTHLMKFGVYYERLTEYGNGGGCCNMNEGFLNPTTWGGLTTGNAYADLLVGYIGSFSQATANLLGSDHANQFDFYAQDSWKARRRLTLLYGARFYHVGNHISDQGFIHIFDPTKYDPNAPISAYSGVLDHAHDPSVPASAFPSTGLRVGPHLGFAYDVSGNGTTVIRGGFGTSFFRDRSDFAGQAGGGPPEFLFTSVCCGFTLSQLDAMSASAPQVGVIVVDPSDHHVPLIYSYSLTVSKMLPKATALEVSYVGNSSHNLPVPQGSNNIDAVPQGAELGLPNPGTSTDQSFRPYAAYFSINQAIHALTSHYDSLQVTARRTTGRLNYWASYTYGKALGDASYFFGGGGLVDTFDRRHRSYGILPWDRTHIFSIAYNFRAPDFGSMYLGNHLITNGVFNGWQISGITKLQSGEPLQGVGTGSELNSASISFDGSGIDLSPRVIAGTPDTTTHPFLSCDPTKGLQKHQTFNAACFVAPSPGQNGFYLLPYIRGPWFNNHDLSLFKNFRAGKNEARSVQFRFSAFNFLNHPLWSFVGTNDPGLHVRFTGYGQPAVTPTNGMESGFVTNKVGHRIVELALKYYF